LQDGLGGLLGVSFPHHPKRPAPLPAVVAADWRVLLTEASAASEKIVPAT
jgi:hypothetical protein